MAMQFSEQRTLFGVQQPDDGIHAAARKPTSIPAPGYCQNPLTLSLKTRQFCTGSSIPKVRSIITTTHQLPVGAKGNECDRNVVIPYRPDGRSTVQVP